MGHMSFRGKRRVSKTWHSLDLKGENPPVGGGSSQQSRIALHNHVMRAALAMAAFVSGTVSVLAFPPDNIPYCSSGFDKPAKIVLNDTASMYLSEESKPETHFDAPDKVTLTVGDKAVVFSFHEPGESATILYYSADYGSPEVTGEAGAYLTSAKIDKTTVILFADRVFWPCDE